MWRPCDSMLFLAVMLTIKQPNPVLKFIGTF